MSDEFTKWGEKTIDSSEMTAWSHEVSSNRYLKCLQHNRAS